MPEPDFNAQLASHDDILRHLVALVVKMDQVIDELKAGQGLIIQTSVKPRASALGI
jgi:hypothetical protein